MVYEQGEVQRRRFKAVAARELRIWSPFYAGRSKFTAWKVALEQGVDVGRLTQLFIIMKVCVDYVPVRVFFLNVYGNCTDSNNA